MPLAVTWLICTIHFISRFLRNADKFLPLPLELLLFKFLQVQQLVTGTLCGARNGIDHDLKSRRVPVLAVLNQEHHEERDDGRAGVNHQLPRIVELEEWSGQCPDNSDEQALRIPTGCPL